MVEIMIGFNMALVYKKVREITRGPINKSKYFVLSSQVYF